MTHQALLGFVTAVADSGLDLGDELWAARTPLFEAAISVAGCHAHFIDDERTRGGHLIDFEMHHGVAEICLGTDLALRLPLTAEFGAADLTPEDLQAQLHKAEHAQH